MLTRMLFIVLMYLAVMAMLMGFILYLLHFSDNATFSQAWLDSTLPMLVDLLKIVVGAVVGSLSACGAMVFDMEKEKSKNYK